MDKFPDFGQPFFYRALLPGILVVGASAPLWLIGGAQLGLSEAELFALIVTCVVVVGVGLSVFDEFIYHVLMGRVLWPEWLREWRVSRWKRYVSDRFSDQKAIRAAQPNSYRQNLKYQDLWAKLRWFPLAEMADGKEVRPSAVRPTLIGNIISGREDYSVRRYGMDYAFYWPRLRLVMDKDTRGEIDNVAAVADGIVYAAAGLTVVAFLYLGAAAWNETASILHLARGWTRLANPVLLLVVSLGLLLVAATMLRVSAMSQLRYAEYYKSCYDLYRSKLNMAKADATERTAWEQLWSWLQYEYEGPVPPVNPT